MMMGDHQQQQLSNNMHGQLKEDYEEERYKEWSRGQVLVTRVTHPSQNHEQLVPLFCFPEVGTCCEMCYDLFFDNEETQFMEQVFCIYYVEIVPLLPHAQPIHDSSFSFEDCVEDLSELITNDMALNTRIHGFATGAGGYLLTLFAVKHRDLVSSMTLISAPAETATWKEYFSIGTQNLRMSVMGIDSSVINSLLKTYFSSNFRKHEEYVIEEFKDYIRKLNPSNLIKFFQSYNRRLDLTHQVKQVHCRILILVGEDSPYFDETMATLSQFDPAQTSWLKIPKCGGLITRERPGEILTSLKLFIQGLGYMLDAHVDASHDLHVKIL